MTPRQIIGLILLIGGVILQPMGWMYEWWLVPLSFLLAMVGVGILMKERDVEAFWREFRASGGNGRGAMPGDIHGHSGQMHGGRSTSWESSHHGGGWDADSGGD